MVLISSTDAASLVTNATGVITDNIGAVVVVLGAFIGLKIGARLLNGSTKGKVRV